jgi:hypothetical protein
VGEFLYPLLTRCLTHSKNFAVKGARKILPKIVIKNLRAFPFPKIIAKSQTARIVALVEKMMNQHRQRTQSKNPHEQTALDRQIAATDAQIDRLVHDLYGLTEEQPGRENEIGRSVPNPGDTNSSIPDREHRQHTQVCMLPMRVAAQCPGD